MSGSEIETRCTALTTVRGTTGFCISRYLLDTGPTVDASCFASCTRSCSPPVMGRWTCRRCGILGEGGTTDSKKCAFDPSMSMICCICYADQHGCRPWCRFCGERWKALQEFEKASDCSGLGDSSKSCYEFIQRVKAIRIKLGPPLQRRLAMIMVSLRSCIHAFC